MAGTVSFSRTVLTPGPHDLGQAPLPVGSSGLELAINRGIVGGLDSVAVSTTLTLVAQYSDDAGATWHDLFTCTTNGGPFVDKHGVTIPQTTVTGSLPDPAVAHVVKASVTITGTSVAVSGTLTVT